MKNLLSFIILCCFMFGFSQRFSTSEAQQCGKAKSEFTELSFGGEIAEETEWPWNVAFIHRPMNNFFCGGSLINSKHVLSAAHCFQNKYIREALSPFLVEAQLGKFNLSVENETGSETLLVWEIVIHPDWKYDQEKYDADLSVVVLEQKVSFNLFIRPICLPNQSDDPVTGTGTVVGWGMSETSGDTSATVPSKLQVPAISADVCYTTFYQLGIYSSTRMFCGGYANLGKAPCLGDSGGGFYLQNKNHVWEIKGIVSGSLKSIEHGCDINKYSLFTHVAKFADWIGKVIIKTMKVDWKFVKFECVEYLISKFIKCSTTFKGPMTRNLKVRTNFSSHKSVNNPIDVTYLSINFSPSTHILSGIGEEFPNLRTLWVIGTLIKFIERQNFANLNQLDNLGIYGTSVDFLPGDLLADLPNLSDLEIRACRQLERLPEKFFMNQRKLKRLRLSGNGLTILQRNLFKNNLKLKIINLWGNKLAEIYVDFTRLPAVKWIYLQDNKCIDQEWEPINRSIRSFQDKINRNCTLSIVA